MPGSGKTTFGKRLAKDQGLGFIDTDRLVEQRERMSFQRILARRGQNYVRNTEQTVVCGLSVQNNVIATGGSVVYSDAAMRHLADGGYIIHLNISLSTVLNRVNDMASRGLVKMPRTSLPALYIERLPLYQRWAEITLDNNYPLTALQFDRLSAAIEAQL